MDLSESPEHRRPDGLIGEGRETEEGGQRDRDTERWWDRVGSEEKKSEMCQSSRHFHLCFGKSQSSSSADTAKQLPYGPIDAGAPHKAVLLSPWEKWHFDCCQVKSRVLSSYKGGSVSTFHVWTDTHHPWKVLCTMKTRIKVSTVDKPDGLHFKYF